MDKKDSVLHPELWKVPGTELTTEKLQDGEKLRSLFSFVTNGKQGQTFNIFTVVETGDRASSRITLRAEIEPGHNHYKVFEFANYPIADVETLIIETQEKALGFAEFIASTEPTKTQLNTDFPLAVLVVPKDKTHKEIVEKMRGDAAQGAEQTMSKTLIETLGLGEQKEFTIAPVLPQDQNLLKMAKILQEKELIKKFGKEKLEELAKKMNYHGETINTN